MSWSVIRWPNGGSTELATALVALNVAGKAEAVVGVLKIWRNAGTGGAPRYFDVVSPGSTTGGLAFGLVWAARVALRRHSVIIRVVPVAAPFVDVVANIVKAKGVGGIAAHRLGTGLPASGVVGERLRRSIAQRKIFLLHSAAGGKLPLGFGGQTVEAGGLRAQPIAVSDSVEPRNSGDRLLRMIEVGIAPKWRCQRGHRPQKGFVFGVGDLRGRQPEAVHPNTMNWTLAVLAGI